MFCCAGFVPGNRRGRQYTAVDPDPGHPGGVAVPLPAHLHPTPARVLQQEETGGLQLPSNIAGLLRSMNPSYNNLKRF